MADRTQLRIADRDDIAEDDPFAELTRIMGFDPRVPVKPQDEARSQPAAEDDFAIDLEKELMGEFGEEPQPAPAPEAAYPQAEESVAEPYAGEERAAQPAEDFFFDESAFDQSADAAPPASAGAAPEEHPDFADFEKMLASDLPDAPQSDKQELGEIEASFASEFEEDAPRETASAEEFPAFDDSDFVFDEPEAAIPAPQEPVASEPHEEGDDFERALAAAVFDEQPTQAGYAEEQDYGAEQAYSQDSYEYSEPEAAPEAPAASLEDELNALLNRMSARPEPAYEPDFQLEKPLDVHVEPAAAPVYEASAQPQESVSNPDDFDLDIDLAAFDAASHADDAREQYADETSADPVEALKPFIPTAAAVAAAAAQAHNWSRGTPFIRPQPDPVQPQVSFAQPVQQTGATAYHYEAEPAAGSYEVEQDYRTTDQVGAETPAAYSELSEVAAAPARPPVAEIPELETIEIPEKAVALADDLDIPDVPFEEDKTEAPAYDDLDAEFSSLLNEMNVGEPTPAPEPAQQAAAFQAPRQQPEQAAAGGSAQVTADAYDQAFDDFEFDAAASQPYAPQAAADDGFDYDPDAGETMSEAGETEEQRPRNRMLLAAAVVGAVALIGGIGAFALSFGGGGSGDAPVLVKADDAPIKVKPENPGGTVIPNQDNKVYDMVAKGGRPAAPTQEKLVSDAEQPIDVTSTAPEARVVGGLPVDEAAQPAGKSEDRVAPALVENDAAADEVPAVAPRKVRTMVVRPDGTLVPREDPAPAQQIAATEPTDPAPQAVSAPGAEQTGAVTPAAPQQSANTPSAAPVAPQRPAEQPVDIVGEVKPGQVAALDPNAAAAGTWAMQIASQPSVEAAQSTYQDLARRYASVLEGRSVNIVKAEVAGKGTFYRVRVAADSRAEAISLCEKYKAAGGACFVSK